MWAKTMGMAIDWANADIAPALPATVSLQAGAWDPAIPLLLILDC
jgi:hypothetical protein